MSTVLDLITDSLKNLGVISGTETPSADEAQDGLNALNRMLDSWNAERLMIYTISSAAYNLNPGQMVYQIGPGAVDFDTVRPQKIKNANIILTNVSPNTRIPLDLLDDDQWASIRQQQVQSNIPSALYNDGSYPISNLYLWGQPQAGLQLELYTWSLLTGFPDIDQEVSLPPGYQEAVLYNLAVRMAPQMGTRALGALSVIQPLADAAKARVKAMNNQTPLMIADPAVRSNTAKTRFNIYTGDAN